MELLFSPLFSGSSGNCVFIACGENRILVDAGVSCARITKEMKAIGARPEELSGILITHEHADHVAGAGILSRRYNIPLYATEGTWRGMAEKIGDIDPGNMRLIDSKQDFYIGCMDIVPFDTPHDANQPCGYSIFAGGCKISVATDLGCVKESWMRAVDDSDMLLLESNYDADMLKAGPYPFALKTRIMGKKGHLSNDDAGAAAVQLTRRGVRHIVLGHMSKENNFPELAWETTALAMREAGIAPGADVGLTLAYRDRMSGLFSVCRGIDTRRRI